MTIEQTIELARDLHRSGQLGQAETLYREVLAAQPDNPDALHLLGLLAVHVGRLDVGVDLIRRAIGVNPTRADYHLDLGLALDKLGRLDEAISAFRQSLALRPDYSEAHNNMGSALYQKRELDQAIASYRAALAARTDYASAHWNLGLALLLQGDMENGWPEFEWRTQVHKFALDMEGLVQPRWDGGELNGRRILLYAQQGFGDAIQFVRYIPRVVQRGGKVMLAAQPELLPLLQNMKGIEEFAAIGQPRPDFDLHVPLDSLPRLFKTTLNTIPATVPYLSPDPAIAEKWKTRLATARPPYQTPAKLRIGLAWAGRPSHPNDRNRSFPPATFDPLLAIEGLWLFSLQVPGESKSNRLTDCTSDLRDFAQTAGLIENLDLVITADTAVAHLAGAIGKRVWVLLPFVPDWRWMLNRNDSPWYPTMRLFRQPRIGDWQTPIGQIVDALRSL